MKKFSPSSFTTLEIRILSMLEPEEGTYPSKIARLLGIKKELVNYYLKKFIRQGLVKKKKLGKITVYSLTDAGREIISTGGGFGGLVRLHGVCVGFGVLVGPGVGVDLGRVRRVVMGGGWSRFVGRFRGVCWELHLGCREPRLLVFPEPLEGRDPWELFALAIMEAHEVASELEARLQMRLGKMQLIKRGEWSFFDPVARCFAQGVNVKTEVGALDRSPPYRCGEVEYFSPEMAKEYIMMPARIRDITSRLSEIEDKNQQLTQVLEQFSQQLQLHLEVLQGIKQAFQQFVALLNSLQQPTEPRERGKKEPQPNI